MLSTKSEGDSFVFCVLTLIITLCYWCVREKETKKARRRRRDEERLPTRLISEPKHLTTQRQHTKTPNQSCSFQQWVSGPGTLVVFHGDRYGTDTTNAYGHVWEIRLLLSYVSPEHLQFSATEARQSRGACLASGADTDQIYSSIMRALNKGEEMKRWISVEKCRHMGLRGDFEQHSMEIE